MSGHVPTIDSEKKFKEWSNTMKSIHFGLVDVSKSAASQKFLDARGKEGG